MKSMKKWLFPVLFSILCSFLFISCEELLGKMEEEPSSQPAQHTEDYEKEKYLSYIYISRLPKTTEYEVNSYLDLSGLVVMGVYVDKYGNYLDEFEIDDWYSSPKNYSTLYYTGWQTVYIYYYGKVPTLDGWGELQTSFDIKVRDYYTPPTPQVISDSYFWGTWVRMDKGTEYEILESTVKYNEYGYTQYATITASTTDTLTVNGIGEFKKQSDSVMICNKIPYFRKGGANLEYSLKVVGFASSSRAAGTDVSEKQGVKATSKSETYPSYNSGERESNEKGIITFNAPTANDTQTVTIQKSEDEVVVVPGLKISNKGDFMGTVALVDKNQYNLKITGSISDDQKDNGYLYGNNFKEYELNIAITNISDVDCSASVCTIESADSNLNLRTSTGYAAESISTLKKRATKNLTCTISYGKITEAYVDTGINITIENSDTGQVWTDYIPLRFFKGLIPITVAAKSPEDNNQAALNGFIIYPDGNNQFFSVNNDSSKILFVPSFGANEQYKMVFSGATVTSELSNSTEMYYTVVPASSTKKEPIVRSDDSNELLKYMRFGDNNHNEENAYNVYEPFEAYLSEGQIDYYSIIADGNEFYAPGNKSFYEIKFDTGYADIPAPTSFYWQSGNRLTAEKLPVLERTGMKFLGWYYYNGYDYYSADNYYVYSNMTLSAKWELYNYSITYETNGGENSYYNQTSYTIESSNVYLYEPSRPGYEFQGWYSDSYFEGEKQTYIPSGSIGERTFYAKWNPITYSISYVLNGGDPAENPTSYTADDYIWLKNPTRFGYVFKGWYPTEYLDYYGDYNIAAINTGSYGNKTLYARWTPTEYYIKYLSYDYGDYYDGDYYFICDSTYYTIEDGTVTLQQPSITGYEFLGWYESSDFSGEPVTEINTSSPKNYSLYAKWDTKVYNITYELYNNGDEIGNMESNPATYTKDSETIYLQTPTRPGYEFGGWYSSSSFYSYYQVYSISQGSTGDRTFYAKWNPISYSIYYYDYDYEFNYYADGGFYQYDSLWYTRESTTITLPRLSRTGYNFLGWCDNPDFNGEVFTELNTDNPKNYVLYAKWDLVNYNITYNLNCDSAEVSGMESNPATYTINDYVYLSNPTRVGYNFEGWYTTSYLDYYGNYSSKNVISYNSYYDCGDITLYAKWSLRTYSITYILNGGSNDYQNPIEYTMEDESITLTEPSRNGYAFKGWYETPDYEGESVTVITTETPKNYSLYAKWEAITYNITYVLNENGDEIGNMESTPTTYTIESETIYLPSPTRSGYTFNNWYYLNDYGNSYTISSINNGSYGDKTLYASWSPISYSIIYNDYSYYDEYFYQYLKTSYTRESDTVTLQPLSKNGFNFLGWYESSDYTGEVLTEINPNSIKDYMLYAKWELAEYTIAYNLNASDSDVENMEDAPSSYTIETSTFNLPVPTRTGYKFGGWYTTETLDASCKISTIYNGNYFNNLNLYAKWIKLVTIDYVSDYGTTPESITIEEGETLSSYLSNIFELGWNLDGWFFDSSYTVQATEDYVVSDSITLYAKWSEYNNWQVTGNNGSYSFNKDGDIWTASNMNNYNYADTTWQIDIKSPVKYTIDYSIFSDYYDSFSLVLDDTTIYTKPSYRTVSYSSNYPVILTTGIHTLRASYNRDSSYYYNNSNIYATLTLADVDYENQAYILYNIDYSTTHGTQPQSIELEKGTVLSSSYLPELSQSGCEFLGWRIDNEEVPDDYVIQDNITLTAEWELIDYKITYITNGGKKTSNPSTYNVEDRIQFNDPKYDGYTFAGWFLDSDFTQKITGISPGSRTGDITLYARWGQAGGVTVSLKEYNDINLDYTQNGNYITFTGIETDNYTNFEWQVDGSKIQTANNYLTVNVSNWRRGKHTIMLFASNSSGKKRNATAYVVIE